MKKQVCLLLSLLSLSACQTAGLAPLAPLANPSLSAQSTPRIMESFKGYVWHSPYDQSKLAEMLMEVRSLFGSTYDNRNSASRYHLFYQNQTDFLAQAHGPIRLGKDGFLYLEELEFSNGQRRLLYYRLGSFQSDKLGADGSPLPFELDQGNDLKMKWRGINPMNHNEIHLKIAPSVKPVEKPASDFF